MANRSAGKPTGSDSSGKEALPDWWQREKQRRQLRTLLFLVALLALIAFYYHQSSHGVVGAAPTINFDSTNCIAFVRQEKDGSSGLYVISADGSHLHRLTRPDDRSDKFNPTWTTDGTSLIYASNLKDNRVRQIYLLGHDEIKQLTYGPGNKDAPVACPDGKTIAFMTQGAVKTVQLNGTDVYQIMPPPRGGSEGSDEASSAAFIEPNGAFHNAAFSHDGQGIAGVQELNSQIALGNITLLEGDLVARALTPGSSRALILDSGRDVSVAWEPNGTRLACAYADFSVGSGKKSASISGINIYSFDDPNRPIGKPLFRALGPSIEPRNIAWSPDGMKMAFEGWRVKGEGDRDLRGIMVMSTDRMGVEVTPATADAPPYRIPASAAGRPQRPQWSPDGRRLLYEMLRPDGGHDLWVINATDLTNPINLTQGVGDNTQGAWSPGGHAGSEKL